MGILIGMDEAGYGPQLGPLVIAATAWQVPDDLTDDGAVASATMKSARKKRANANTSTNSATAVLNPQSARSLSAAAENPKSRHPDLYRLLRPIVCKKPSDRQLAVADSKVLYSPGNGLRQLERGLHTILLAMQQNISCWSSIVKYANADPDGHYSRTCWPDGHNCALPVDASNDEVTKLQIRFSRVCDGASVKPLLIRARLVFPEQFNNLIAHYGSKGAALSHITVGLLREVVDAVALSLTSDLRPPTSFYTVCDKHGGRNYYTAL